MRRPITALFAAALALGLFIAVPGFAHHPGDHPQGKHGSNDRLVHECQNADGEVIYEGPIEMWPPNHKYRDLSVTAEKNGSMIRLDTVVAHNEYLTPFMPDPDDAQDPDEEELNGAGNTTSDSDPFWDGAMGNDEVTTDHKVRSERSGRGVGRTYTLHAWAEFGGEPCNSNGDPVIWEIHVPHSQGNSATVKKNHNE